MKFCIFIRIVIKIPKIKKQNRKMRVFSFSNKCQSGDTSDFKTVYVPLVCKAGRTQVYTARTQILYLFTKRFECTLVRSIPNVIKCALRNATSQLNMRTVIFVRLLQIVSNHNLLITRLKARTTSIHIFFITTIFFIHFSLSFP